MIKSTCPEETRRLLAEQGSCSCASWTGWQPAADCLCINNQNNQNLCRQLYNRTCQKAGHYKELNGGNWTENESCGDNDDSDLEQYWGCSDEPTTSYSTPTTIKPTTNTLFSKTPNIGTPKQVETSIWVPIVVVVAVNFLAALVYGITLSCKRRNQAKKTKEEKKRRILKSLKKTYDDPYENEVYAIAYQCNSYRYNRYSVATDKDQGSVIYEEYQEFRKN